MMAGPNVSDMAAATEIALSECARAGLTPVEAFGPSRMKSLARLRARIAYRIWTECDSLSLSEVARAIGRTNHATAIHAILAGATADGRAVARVSDLRSGGDDLDWTKFAYTAAGWRSARDLTLDQAARRAGVGRGEWRKAENGRSVAVSTFLRIARAIGFDPFAALPPATAGKFSTPVSCETKQEKHHAAG